MNGALVTSLEIMAFCAGLPPVDLLADLSMTSQLLLVVLSGLCVQMLTVISEGGVEC